ncbi:thiol-disulfide oxidoreductase DCC family protein [Salibacterium sp. K-3]
MNHEPAIVVFYDQSCGICRESKRIIEKGDRTGKIIWRDIQEPGILEDYPFLKGRNVQEAMHMLENGTYLYTGFAAVKRLIQLLPAGKWVSPLLQLPGVDCAGRRVYRLVARNRHRLSGKSCSSGTCGVPGA